MSLHAILCFYFLNLTSYQADVSSLLIPYTIVVSLTVLKTPLGR